MGKFNQALFSKSFKTKRGRVSLRDLADEIGTSASTLSRIENGTMPDIEVFLSICEWMEVLPTAFFIEDNIEQVDTLTLIVSILKEDNSLDKEFIDALIGLLKISFRLASKPD